jgi:hypothetical protein
MSGMAIASRPARRERIRKPPVLGGGLVMSERWWVTILAELALAAWFVVLALQQFPNVEAQQDYVGQLLRAYEARTLQSLTGYAYLVDAINALAS